MAKLFQVTEESKDSLVHTTAIVKLYGSYKIQSAREIDGKANITLEGLGLEGTPSDRVVSEDLTTVVAAANAAEEDTRVLNLSVVDDQETPAVDFTAYNKMFVIDDIIEVTADPANAAQSVIISNEYRKTKATQLIVGDTVANILAAANA